MCSTKPETTVSIPQPSLDPSAMPLATRASSHFLQLPRELRNHIYNHVFSIPEDRDPDALKIERRHLSQFKPTPASILLILHHECLLLNRQIAAEALEILFKKHTVYFSCGPFVLNAILARIERLQDGGGEEWLGWLKDIELDWVTFPNLRYYPPREKKWVKVRAEHFLNACQEQGQEDCSVYEEDISIAASKHYDDNLYDPDNMAVWGPWGPTGSEDDEHCYDYDDAEDYASFSDNNEALPHNDDDPFGFSSHYPFNNPLAEPNYDEAALASNYTALDQLVDYEVSPLFTYLSSPVFKLRSITLPLYFISRQTYQIRAFNRSPEYVLPLKLRYWVNVVAQAFMLLSPPAHDPNDTSAFTEPSPKLDEIKIKLMPWNVWASMDPADNLADMVANGLWTTDRDKNLVVQGEAFKAIKEVLEQRGFKWEPNSLDLDIKLVQWQGDLKGFRVGDELEIIVRRVKMS